MATFIQNVLTAHFALVFVCLLICLFGHGIPGYQARASGGVGGFAWVVWFLAAVVCLIVCVKIAFGL